LQKPIIVNAVLINLFDLLQYLAGYPALTGNPVSGFWISWISGWPDIRQKQYPVHP
jgi:hypothetical protein